MKIFTKKKELQHYILEEKASGKKVGFVPTMGYLHPGHLKLAKESAKDNDLTVMSIFVNPLQFGPNEDYQTYPRNLTQDQYLAKDAGVDLLFIPEVSEMYNYENAFTVNVHQRTDQLCGKSRPGHFDGVATILIKLFHLVNPNRVYFGLKDAQQVAIVDLLIEFFDFPIELVAIDTIREQDGLARSSRNIHLVDSERHEAPHIYKSLQLAKDIIHNGERTPDKVKQAICHYIEERTTGNIDYVELLSYPDLKAIQTIHGNIIVAVAVRFSKTRLIDNVRISIER